MEENFNKICRLCMHIRKHLRPISEKVAHFTYADLIYKVTNVKITEEENLPNKICTFCRTKTRDGYQFIEMVERSDGELRRKAGLAPRRIKFNNIEDIKVEIDIKDIKVKGEEVVDYSNIVSFDFIEDEDIVFNNTVIKKVQPDSSFDYDKTKDSQLSVGDFLNSIKENEDDDIDYNDCDIDVEPVQDSYSEEDSDDDKPLLSRKKKRIKQKDEDYVPGAQNKNKPLPQNKEHTNVNKNVGVRKAKSLTALTVAIKPTFIKDILLIKTGTLGWGRPKGPLKSTLCPYCGLSTTNLKTHILVHEESNYHRRWNKTGRHNSHRLTGQETLLKVAIKPVVIQDENLRLVAAVLERRKRTVKPKQPKPNGELCPYCGLYIKQHNMKDHMLRHTGTRSHKCDVCDKSFYTLNNMLNHKSQTHRERTVQCELCVAKFKDMNALKTHMYSHSDERNFICDVCNKGFKHKRALLRHVIRHNIANKKVKCELCSMTFFEPAQLKNHMRIHTGERPYKCELCNQPYSYKHDFNRHCLKKHGIFFKRRSEYVLNEEVLAREKTFMKELYLRSKGIMRDDQTLNPFEGPQAAKTFEAAMQAIETNVIPVERIFDDCQL